MHLRDSEIQVRRIPIAKLRKLVLKNIIIIIITKRWLFILCCQSIYIFHNFQVRIFLDKSTVLANS